MPVHANYLAAGVIHHNTTAGAMESAMHLTGQYPDWWAGHRFPGPIRCWIGAENTRQLREATQVVVLGDPTRPDMLGTGAIPRNAIERLTRMRGTADVFDTVVVKHVSGGVSVASFKTYEERRQAWAGAQQNLVWFDEEPPEDIYVEGLTRTNDTSGITMITFTPLFGATNVVRMFLAEGSLKKINDDAAKALV